jgi:hypothetical protein
MTTRAELIGLIRAELNDGGGTALWSDALMRQWIGEAIREYGERLPREAETTLTTAAGTATYALPTDVGRVLRVEYPATLFRVPAPAAAGDGLAADSGGVEDGPLAYDVFGGLLVLEPAPDADGEPIGVRYLGRYAEPMADGDVLATPPADDALLVWQVCARALDWITTDEAKRMRYERDRGASAAGQAERYRGRYLEVVGLRTRRLRPARRLVVR